MYFAIGRHRENYCINFKIGEILMPHFSSIIFSVLFLTSLVHVYSVATFID